MPPRKSVEATEAVEAAEPAAAPIPVPPGPITLEIRVNGKIACLQRVYSYKIDQQESHLTVNGQLRPIE